MLTLRERVDLVVTEGMSVNCSESRASVKGRRPGSENLSPLLCSGECGEPSMDLISDEPWLSSRVQSYWLCCWKYLVASGTTV